MKKVIDPKREEWEVLLARPQMKNADLEKICKDIFSEIRKNGDQALRKYTWFFDRVQIGELAVSEAEFEAAAGLVPEDLKQAIREAKRNIEAFHTLQKSGRLEYVNEKGFRCWQEALSRPLR